MTDERDQSAWTWLTEDDLAQRARLAIPFALVMLAYVVVFGQFNVLASTCCAYFSILEAGWLLAGLIPSIALSGALGVLLWTGWFGRPTDRGIVLMPVGFVIATLLTGGLIGGVTALFVAGPGALIPALVFGAAVAAASVVQSWLSVLAYVLGCGICYVAAARHRGRS